MPDVSRRLVAEALGAFFLLAAVVGSGVMAERLAGGNVAIALLGNTIATGAILVVRGGGNVSNSGILAFGPVSGAHLNPAVSLAFALRRELSWADFGAYVVAQIVGAVLGVWAVHIMFDLPLLQFSQTLRTGPGQWVAEAVATFALLVTIFGCLAREKSAIPYAVGLYITSAYWFTASTSFANPAVTIARALSNTFAGISPRHVVSFIVAQLLGAGLALLVSRWLWRTPATHEIQ
jgi:glycerol uptake facilitator-like aquaporin